MRFNDRPPRERELYGVIATEFDETEFRAEFNHWFDSVFEDTDWLTMQDRDED